MAIILVAVSASSLGFLRILLVFLRFLFHLCGWLGIQLIHDLVFQSLLDTLCMLDFCGRFCNCF